MNCSTSEKATISSNLRVDLRPLHAQDGAVQVDVLPPGQLGVEAGAHLQQRAHPPVDLGIPLGRLGDPGEDLQQRALPGPVAPDDPQHLAVLDLERRCPSAPRNGCRSAFPASYFSRRHGVKPALWR